RRRRGVVAQAAHAARRVTCPRGAAADGAPMAAAPQARRRGRRHLPRASLRRGEHGRALARGRLRFARRALRARPGARHALAHGVFIAGLPLCWQTHARSTARPDLKREIERPPKRMRHVNHKRGAELVDAARVATLTRERDLEQIAYAYPGDAWILEDEDGLCFVALGKVPERRFVLEATYVYLVVKNGVPVGYLQGSGLGGGAEINYNIFPPWRGRDAAALYARSLAVIHAFQHVSTFIVDPYQLGADNEEAIESGAWWVYYKLGFRPRDRKARAPALRQQERVTKRASYRSSPSTLRELALSPMVLQLYDKPRFPYGGVGPVGLHASHRLSERGGGLRS